ncbi:MAG TPA: proliferating cell nuclear antigen (pcna) [Thermoplasmatales archaeon]|nr:proliferating cell nuclear antigen (pcna) [Thermoplasmatales archaeon]
MFQGKLKAGFTKVLVDAISVLVDETKFKISPDGIYGRTFDPAHVGMIDFKIKKEIFEEYECKEETEIGVDLEKLKDIIKIATNEEIIEFQHDKSEGRLIVTKGNITRKLSLLDTSEMRDTKAPSLDLPAEIVAPIAEIAQAIKVAESFSDHVTLMADSEGFQMIAEGDSDVLELKLSKDKLYNLKCEEKVKSMFPLDYFSKMIKMAGSKSDEITINLGNDYPIKLSFEIAEGNIKIIYLLAPRIES